MGDLSYPEPAGYAAAEARAAPLAGSAGTGLFGLYVAAFLVSLDRAVFAPLIPALSRDFHETVGAVGLAVSAYTLPYGLFQLGYGPLGDRAGKLTVIRWTFLIFAFGTGLCGLAMTLPMLDLLRAVTGACAAAIIPLALAYIGDVVPYERRQPTITNLMGATSSGNALSAVFGGVIGQFLSWRALFGLYGVCALLIAIALFRASATEHIAPKTAATPANRQYGELLRLRRARFLYILVGLEGAFVYAGFTYLGAYLSHRFALDYFTIGLILAGYGTGTLLTSLVVRHALRGESHPDRWPAASDGLPGAPAARAVVDQCGADALDGRGVRTLPFDPANTRDRAGAVAAWHVGRAVRVLALPG